jgi:hemolysin activation/secretion protein
MNHTEDKSTSVLAAGGRAFQPAKWGGTAEHRRIVGGLWRDLFQFVIVFVFWCCSSAAVHAADAAGNPEDSGQEPYLRTPISPEYFARARAALEAKLAELETNAVQNSTTNRQLILAPAKTPPTKDAIEALRQKIKDLDAEEQAARRRAAHFAAATNAITATNVPVFVVNEYEVSGLKAPTNLTAAFFIKHTGTNVTVDEIASAASDLQAEYLAQGIPDVCVAFEPRSISNGVVTLNVAKVTSPKIMVSGKLYVQPVLAQTNANASQKFAVNGYEVTGNTVLSDETLKSILIDYTGTNIGIPDIIRAASDLQLEYRDRGYPTIGVTLPPQQITDGIVKIRVFEGRLAEIQVVGNHYFSSNNVMRALPSLHTNMLLLRPVFEAELDRANANQDRQIYPTIEPGPEPGTSDLRLTVKDRLPLHGKVELNNQNSPGTPDLRVSSSLAYNNLLDWEHSAGLQYSFSPEKYKQGNDWNLPDEPLVANYSGFYRMPLGNQEPIGDEVTTKPGSFGYQEATRKFQMPPATGRPEVTLYGSRSTVDTGLEAGTPETLVSVPGVRTLTRQDNEQDLTINNAVGFRLTKPFRPVGDFNSSVSGGLDFKNYELTVAKTNTFIDTEIIYNAENQPIFPPRRTVTRSPVPLTQRPLDYLPLVVRYDGSWHEPDGKLNLAFGVGLNYNTWYSPKTSTSGSGTNKINVNNIQAIAGSKEATGYWVTLNPTWTADVTLPRSWTLSIHQEGQWASEPLISNEQFGAGGVQNVRGYHEGELFGDLGWRENLELKTPPHVVGLAYGNNLGSGKLVIRGTFFMDYARVMLLDPQGRPPHQDLWSAGFGVVGSIGPHWESRLLFAVPFEGTTTTSALQPYFGFALTGQF